MYALPNSNRIYTLILFCLCAAFFLAPTLANANEYWSTSEKRMISQSEVSNRVNRMLSQATSMPSGSTLSTVPSSPTVTKNPLGGLSQTSQNVIKTMGQPSSFNSTLNNSVGAAQTALKSCIRTPACAARALGAGAVIYEGINAWKEVYDLTLGANGELSQSKPKNVGSNTPDGNTCTIIGEPYGSFPSCQQAFEAWEQYYCEELEREFCPVYLAQSGNSFTIRRVSNNGVYGTLSVPSNPCPAGSVLQAEGCLSLTDTENVPVSEQYLDDALENYEPSVSDAPIVLLSGEFETITLSTPASAELPSTTTTSTDANGQTTTSVTNKTINYNVTNNNTSNPSINSSLVETTTTYDTTGNVTDTTTSTITANGVPSDAPSSSPISDIELPAFCTWASIVCDWIGWTKEGIEGEEPDLINLISEFEPDENQYDSGIGSGSCPAPMSLNLGIVNRVVEVSYQPFCDFLDMIRPLVIAGAWLLSAFMYVGVLRRG